MDRFIKLLLFAVPIAAIVGLVIFIARPDLITTGPRVVLEEKLRAAQTDFPCPDYAYIREHILSGGPPKDGIPAVDKPDYVNASEAELPDSTIVFGISLPGFVAAYPKPIMVWHEVVNDEHDDLPISITYCPLTRSALGFFGRSLGVTGTLYNNNLIMYDRATTSRIPQLTGVGIDGELCGQLLPTFPVRTTTWGKWRSKHPQTLVLTTNTGYRRDYKTDPYAEYYQNDDVYFPLTTESMALPPKSMVLGLELNDESAAVPLDGFLENYPDGITFILGGGLVTVWWDTELQLLRADDDVKQMEVFWFAWFAQHPETKIIH
ncbi:MAG: DUF3179 domain-containing protein [Proteobacteria bacterium]|nr:DUF3179 domain-containing protein [Pseudomonadota bacterium]MBU1612146.1 DUF3179 domain-containing protein [Pseudomonadota bacterium]